MFGETFRFQEAVYYVFKPSQGCLSIYRNLSNMNKLFEISFSHSFAQILLNPAKT